MNRLHRWICSSGLWRRALETRILPWVFEDVGLGDSLLEVGAGPGLTTNWLRSRVPSVTALEIDSQLAASLKKRLGSANVRVIQGDATQMAFDDATFSSAASLTMLHHVPSPELQDQLLRQVFRVLRPGGWFLGVDSISSLLFQIAHLGDTLVPVVPESFKRRLEASGFKEAIVERRGRAFRFRAKKR